MKTGFGRRDACPTRPFSKQEDGNGRAAQPSGLPCRCSDSDSDSDSDSAFASASPPPYSYGTFSAFPDFEDFSAVSMTPMTRRADSGVTSNGAPSYKCFARFT